MRGIYLHLSWTGIQMVVHKYASLPLVNTSEERILASHTQVVDSTSIQQVVVSHLMIAQDNRW